MRNLDLDIVVLLRRNEKNNFDSIVDPLCCWYTLETQMFL